MTEQDYRHILEEQLGWDYCCSVEEMHVPRNIFHEYVPNEHRRKWREEGTCPLKIISYKNKLVFAGRADIIAWCQEQYADRTGDWFMEPGNLRALDRYLQEQGFEISHLHPFLISTEKSYPAPSDYGIVVYRGEEIEQFRGDERFQEAYSFDPQAPDVVGAAAVKDGEILGMAGASADSDHMWQIGINVLPAARGRKIGAALTQTVRNEILDSGRLPFYGTAISHTLSLNVAIASGFRVGWTELSASVVK